MSEERVFSFGNRWFTASVGGIVAIFIVSMLIGFIWLPSKQADFTQGGLWATICRAAGIPSSWYTDSANIAGPAPSEVVVLPPLRRPDPNPLSVGRGATLAQNCEMCHGVQSVIQVTAPVLAAQHADVIYKELRDFQSGQRASAIMPPIVRNLSDRDLHDLANYYSTLPLPTPVETGSVDDSSILKLIRDGSPMRNIAPCASCHGERDRKGAAPRLGGQSSVYLAAQLRLFASGERHNDINEQMRNVARNMTPEEIDGAARFYALQR